MGLGCAPGRGVGHGHVDTVGAAGGGCEGVGGAAVRVQGGVRWAWGTGARRSVFGGDRDGPWVMAEVARSERDNWRGSVRECEEPRG